MNKDPNTDSGLNPLKVNYKDTYEKFGMKD